jgi:hypothetical protein
VYKDLYLYSNDAALLDCGLDEYHRLNRNFDVNCYKEADLREMCTRMVPYTLCAEMGEGIYSRWGLDPTTLYCVDPQKGAETRARHNWKYVLAESNGYSLRLL